MNQERPLAGVRALIIDMDGVLWHGSQPLPGIREFFAALRARRLPFVLATNNASSTPAQYVAKLAGMGVKVSEDEILTSGIATAAWLAQRRDPASSRVYAIGEAGLTEPLRQQGFTLACSHKEGGDWQADVVVVGKDETLTWDKLATATLNLNRGAAFIGTNADVTLPMELGISHGNGAILAALTAATGREPTIIGKPEPELYRQALRRLEAAPEDVVAIGDRLETDIFGAVRAGIRSLMVLTGVSREADLAQVDYRPDWILADIREVTRVLEEG
ncbi:HAD-IIA family hydrolase [Methylomarinovum tepidoasis]|uniref:HAD-IIA family hydrolase n=1 Tax=Methylomarinovum tepidoasis TaxID=2840183 RepID=UPI00257445D7|nr:HAD-IIA family hydrolase [Methylomarinovum sp. IN45]